MSRAYCRPCQNAGYGHCGLCKRPDVVDDKTGHVPKYPKPKSAPTPPEEKNETT